jgi:chromosomal replication initiation ATPase DnaA
VRRQIYLGDRRFLEEMSSQAKRLRSAQEIPAAQRALSVVEIEEIRRLVAKEWGLPPQDLAGREAGDAKLAAIYLCRRLCGKSAREIGDAFGIKRGRVGNIMVEIQKRRRRYLRERVERLVADLETRGGMT